MSVLWRVRWMSIPGESISLFCRPHPSLVLKSFGPGKQLSYDTQLDLKRNVIVKAYRNFSGTTHKYPQPYTTER